MYRISIAAAVAAAGLLVPGTAMSQSADGHTMSATEHVTLQQWSERMQRALDDTLHYPVSVGGQPFAVGTVMVKFNCSDTGRPDKVSLARSSGSGALDRAALKAVRNILTMHPLPDGMGHDQQYQALIMFDDDQRRYDQKVAAMRADATRRNGWFKPPATTAMLFGPVRTAP